MTAVRAGEEGWGDSGMTLLWILFGLIAAALCFRKDGQRGRSHGPASVPPRFPSSNPWGVAAECPHCHAKQILYPPPNVTGTTICTCPSCNLNYWVRAERYLEIVERTRVARMRWEARLVAYNAFMSARA